MKIRRKILDKRASAILVSVFLLVCSSVMPSHAQAPEGMVGVPAGEFVMGIDQGDIAKITRDIGGQENELMSALPRHKVNLGGFFIDKFEVTNNEYKKFMDAAGHNPPEEGWEGGKSPAGKGDFPVVFVSWHDAKAYCKWKGKRLPTEQEWEKAARGTDGRYFPWGNKYRLRKYANTNKERKRGTTKVGAYSQGVSPNGCYDMAGNVWEWTSSNYLAYPNSPHEDEFYGNERWVIRGGSWDDPHNYSMAVIRAKVTPVSSDELTGFRCVMDAGSAVVVSAPAIETPRKRRPPKRRRPPSRKRRKKPGRSSASSVLLPGASILIPAGEFQMGLNDSDLTPIVDDLGGTEKYHFNATPKHTVNLPDFYMDNTEVTNEEYKKFMDAAGHNPPEEGWDGGNFPKKAARKPVVYVNLEDAKAFCKWKGKRLPSEEEWEKAARGADGRLFPWGKRFGRKSAITNKARKNAPEDVGRAKGESPYGCKDMAGNVWEWTTSYYLPYEGNAHEDEFYGKERNVIRGGSFLDFPYDALTTVRSKFTPVTTDENLGFRCAKSR